MPSTSKKLGGHIALACPSITPDVTLLRPIVSLEFLKFHICIAYEKLLDPYFFFFYVRFFMELWPLFSLTHFSKLRAYEETVYGTT